MTDEELLREANFRGPHSPLIATILTRFEALIDGAAEARRQALYDAAADFEDGATPDDIRSNAERIK